MMVDKLYDFPVSNHGARCRYIIYTKGIEDKVKICSPAELGGFKSPEYLKISPQGKSPALVTEEGAGFCESDTIARYLLERYAGDGPTTALRPASLLERTHADQIARFHDIYVSPIQSCMYRAAPPFGPFTCRTEALQELKRQLAILSQLSEAAAAACGGGPFLAGGAEASLADATFFPTFVFMAFMLPKFGWTNEDIFSPRLRRWWEAISAQPVAQRIKGEIEGALTGWDEKNRWSTIKGAGLRDTAPKTIFDEIIARRIPSSIVYEDDKVLAFKDINPKAETHMLLVPKERNGLTQLRNAVGEDQAILGRLLLAAATIAREQDLGSYRLEINDGAPLQEVFHLHVHLLSSTSLKRTPPPAKV